MGSGPNAIRTARTNTRDVGEGAVQVVLELECCGDMISGRLVDRQGGSRDFYGWMRLIALLEAVRVEEATREEPGRERLP